MSDKAKIKATRRSKRKFKKRQQMSNAVVKDTKRRNDPNNKVNTKELEFDIFKRFENVLRNDYGLDLDKDDPQYQERFEFYMIGVAEVFKYLDHDISRVSNEDASFLYVYLRTSILGYWNERNKATAPVEASKEQDALAKIEVDELIADAEAGADKVIADLGEELRKQESEALELAEDAIDSLEPVKINALLYPESRGKIESVSEDDVNPKA